MLKLNLGRNLRLYDPEGRLFDEESGMEVLLNLESVLIVNIKTPMAGKGKLANKLKKITVTQSLKLILLLLD